MSGFDVGAFIDDRKVTRLHIVIVVVCALIMIVDGFDIFMIGAIAPAIAAGFHHRPEDMTTVFLFQQIGIAIGCVIVGPVADRYGRKSVLVVCSIGFGLLMVACALSTSLMELAILRGLSGIFLSSVLPIATTLMSEFAPKKTRATFFSILMAGYGAGAAGGGLVAAFLIDLYGWRSGFWLGGLLPLLCAPLLALFLPESLRFRVRRNALDPAIPQTLKSLSPSLILTGTETFVGGEKEEEGKSSLFGVLADGRAVATVLIWLGFFLAMGNGAVLASWTTTFFKQMGGVPIQEFGKVLAIGSLAAAVGNLTVGFLLDTFRARSVLIFCFLGYSISLVGLGFLPFGTFGLAFSLFGQYYFMNAGTSGIAILTSQYYPTEVRGTGMSWGIGAGRIGGIVGPLLGGLALTNHLTLQQTFLLIALVPLAVLVVMLIFLHLTTRGPATPLAIKLNPARTRA